jgi:hypothetical protein
MNLAMGTFRHPITLIGSEGQRQTVEALVDATRLFASFPESVLTALGATELERRGGARLGHLEAELEGHRATIMCVFGADDEPPRIGRHTLDTFLLEADFEEERLGPKTFRLIQHI